MVKANQSAAGSVSTVLDLQVNSLAFGSAPILGEVAFQVKQAETLALVGPSGIGKTSVLRIIAGLETGYRGRCAVTGKVAMVFQEPTLLPWRNARDNICITTGCLPAEADVLLAEVGLADRADAFPLRLSLGQQRRLSLARAFAMKPDLLLMDEPFVSLDPGLVDEMMALFVQLRSSYQVATILVTHVEQEARRLANRIITLGGTPARIISDTVIR